MSMISGDNMFYLDVLLVFVYFYIVNECYFAMTNVIISV